MRWWAARFAARVGGGDGEGGSAAFDGTEDGARSLPEGYDGGDLRDETGTAHSCGHESRAARDEADASEREEPGEAAAWVAFPWEQPGPSSGRKWAALDESDVRGHAVDDARARLRFRLASLRWRAWNLRRSVVFPLLEPRIQHDRFEIPFDAERRRRALVPLDVSSGTEAGSVRASSSVSSERCVCRSWRPGVGVDIQATEPAARLHVGRTFDWMHGRVRVVETPRGGHPFFEPSWWWFTRSPRHEVAALWLVVSDESVLGWGDRIASQLEGLGRVMLAGASRVLEIPGFLLGVQHVVGARAVVVYDRSTQLEQAPAMALEDWPRILSEGVRALERCTCDADAPRGVHARSEQRVRAARTNEEGIALARRLLELEGAPTTRTRVT